MKQEKSRLLAILAHPDDESLGFGGTLAKYSDDGVETYLITATRGEYGWPESSAAYPGENELGKTREAELKQAAKRLGIQEVILLDYIDGNLDQANPIEIVDTIAHHIQRIQPDVVITFDPFGSYGHPDHIAICQFTTAGVVLAASKSIRGDSARHQVKKLYYRVDTSAEMAMYEEVFGELAMTIDDVKRHSTGWKAWSITTRVDIAPYWDTVWQAVKCHQTQIMSIEALEQANAGKPIWQFEGYYRVFSLVNGGRKTESDLFDGLSAETSDH